MTDKTTNKSSREVTKNPREHFMQAIDNELAKFERNEAALRAADRNERASKFGIRTLYLRCSADILSVPVTTISSIQL